MSGRGDEGANLYRQDVAQAVFSVGGFERLKAQRPYDPLVQVLRLGNAQILGRREVTQVYGVAASLLIGTLCVHH